MTILAAVLGLLALASCSALNLLQLASHQPSLSEFLSLVNASGLNATLMSPSPMTVFAPNNSAFENVTLPSNQQDLARIVQGHIVQGNISLAMLNGTLTAMNGDSLAVLSNDTDTLNESKSINDTSIIEPDLYADNGILHIIDKLLTKNDSSSTEDAQSEPGMPDQDTDTESSDNQGVTDTSDAEAGSDDQDKLQPDQASDNDQDQGQDSDSGQMSGSDNGQASDDAQPNGTQAGPTGDGVVVDTNATDTMSNTTSPEPKPDRPISIPPPRLDPSPPSTNMPSPEPGRDPPYSMPHHPPHSMPSGPMGNRY